jgi:hypothetical protein
LWYLEETIRIYLNAGTKKNLLLWSPQKAREVLESYHNDPLNSTLIKWINEDITSLDFLIESKGSS